MSQQHPDYWRAMRADDELTDALVAEYGSRAGDARYWPTSEHPPSIQLLIARKRSADEQFRAVQVARWWRCEECCLEVFARAISGELHPAAPQTPPTFRPPWAEMAPFICTSCARDLEERAELAQAERRAGWDPNP